MKVRAMPPGQFPVRFTVLLVGYGDKPIQFPVHFFIRHLPFSTQTMFAIPISMIASHNHDGVIKFVPGFQLIKQSSQPLINHHRHLVPIVNGSVRRNSLRTKGEAHLSCVSVPVYRWVHCRSCAFLVERHRRTFQHAGPRLRNHFWFAIRYTVPLPETTRNFS